MSLEENIQQAVEMVEEHVKKMYNLKYVGLPKSPPEDIYKSVAMIEIARRVRARAIKIEEDWVHFTRD